MIDWTSKIERYLSHSIFQSAIYIKSVIYLGLNMMLVPSLSLSTHHSSSLWSCLITRKFDLLKLISDFYIGGNGMFFVSLVLQQACTSSAFYLLNITDIYDSYFSPWLAYNKRKVF